MQSQILINKLNTDLELYARNSYIKNGRRSWPKNPFDAFTDEVTQDDGYGFDTLYTDFPNCLSTPMTNQKGMFWSFTNGNINFRNDDSIFVFKYDQNYYGEVEFTMLYKGKSGLPFKWLYLDFQTLTNAAEASGLNCELVLEGEHYDYLARLWRK